MKVERKERQHKAKDNVARGQIGYCDRSEQQQRVGEGRLERRAHAAFSPNASFKSMSPDRSRYSAAAYSRSSAIRASSTPSSPGSTPSARMTAPMSGSFSMSSSV